MSLCEHGNVPEDCAECVRAVLVPQRDRYRRALEAIRDRWPGLAPHEMAEIAAEALKEPTP